jgi:hypothetical protein
MSNHKRRKIIEMIEIAQVLSVTMDDKTLTDALERAKDKALAGITVPKVAAPKIVSRPAGPRPTGTRRSDR